MNLYVAEHGNGEKKALSQLNQECGGEEIDEVEEFSIENSIENWGSPMKVELIARKFAWQLAWKFAYALNDRLEVQQVTQLQCTVPQN